MGQNLLASITHVNVGDVVVSLVLLVFFWLDYAQVCINAKGRDERKERERARGRRQANK